MWALWREDVQHNPAMWNTDREMQVGGGSVSVSDLDSYCCCGDLSLECLPQFCYFSVCIYFLFVFCLVFYCIFKLQKRGGVRFAYQIPLLPSEATFFVLTNSRREVAPAPPSLAPSPGPINPLLEPHVLQFLPSCARSLVRFYFYSEVPQLVRVFAFPYGGVAARSSCVRD